jgi:hypothetical protein
MPSLSTVKGGEQFSDLLGDFGASGGGCDAVFFDL